MSDKRLRVLVIDGDHDILELLEYNLVWGSEIYLVETSIDVYIANLRKKLGLDIIRYEGENRYRLNL